MPTARAPWRAISICSEKAPQLAENMSQNSWAIKRVTDKNRNPGNLANERELEILKQFKDSLEVLKFYDEYIHADSTSNYFFYKPIKTSALCLKCHGKAEGR